MTTYSPASPRQTVAIEALDDRPNAPELVDALPLLDVRLLVRTVASELALHGDYLALSDDAETRLLRLEQPLVHLGSGRAADIRFDDHRVSPDHAIIVRYAGHLRLLDNRSAHGTFVNGRRIAAINVFSGDVIDLGPVRMQLLEIG